jgi:chromosome segregation ATPase
VVRFLTRNENVQKKGFLDILLHTHFLGQHSIRDFIYGNRLDDGEKITTTRYNLLAEMFGFGEVEQLKKRLTGVLTQIKKSKISDADNQIEAAQRQVRGLHQKYGPKCRVELEKKGFQIAPDFAIDRYKRAIGQLEKTFGKNFVKQLVVAQPPMENYMVSCETVHKLLAEHLKLLEKQSTDLKQLGRLIARLHTIFPEIGNLDAGMAKTSIARARKQIDASLETIEGAKHEAQTITPLIESLAASVAQLKKFLNQHGHYLQLCETEQKQVETIAGLQKGKAELLGKRGQLNILALSIFLTRVMYQNISELETVLIDDPIQQMDDMNAAAFVDVILGLSQIGKQIIITTCNQDFYRLVAHKMQNISASGRISFKSVNLDATSIA